VKGNAARVNFIIESKTANGEDVDLLVNETDPFEGLVPIDFQDGQRTSRLVVKAGGAVATRGAPANVGEALR
jgi:hypothetical protein